MAETAALINPERAAELARESDSALFHRRIEFHQARKPLSGFGNNNSKGFKLVTLNPTSEPHVASGLGKKSEKSSEFCETGLDPELSFEISFRRIGAGLRNLGNTCFLNSVLQCLTYTEPLAAYLQSGKHQNSCCTAGFCALCAIQKHVSRALQSTGKVLEPKDLVSNLRRISRSFRNYNQEDAHEYMVYLLESMHKCCLPSGVPSESPSAYEKSLVHKIFGGRLRSQVKCMQCSYRSNKFDPFLDLSLEIAKADSLSKALAHFTSEEHLDGGAKEYQCQQCKQKVQALKNLTIYKAPHVLTVHLKRFRAYAPGQKIDKKVSFEPTLDLKPFVSGPYDGNLKYTLYGVLVHAGWSTRCGHYYCFVRTSSGMWYSLDDNKVVQVNERTVLAQKAYMLFYVRDRTKICPKKPVAGMQNKNMVMNGMGNAASPKLKPELRDKIQNGSNEKGLNGFLSVALSDSDAVVTALREEIPSETICFPNTNSSVDNFDIKRDSKTEHSSVLPPTKDLLKQHSVMDIKSVFHRGEPCSTVNGSGDTVKNNTCNNRSSVKEQKTSGILLANSDMRQTPLHMNESGDLVLMPSGGKDNGKENSSELAKKTPNSSVPSTSSGDTCKMGNSTSEMCASKINAAEAVPEPSIQANHISQQNSVEECQVGGSFVRTAVPSSEETCDYDKKIDVVQSKELSGLPTTREPLAPGITKKRRPNVKVKRKLFKCQIGITSLSSNIILGVGPCVRKKKYKQRKQNSMQKSSIVKHLLDGNVSPSKLGQFLTEESFPVLTDHHSHSLKEKTQCSSDGQILNLSNKNKGGKDCKSFDVIHKEFRGALQDGTTISAEKPTQLMHSAALGSCKSDEELRQTDVMSILTRGLDEITVARWDDVSLSQKSERKAAGTSQIGYIGDEWDEEYDRGKRKKIRGPKIGFGGPNLFQEIATKNSKRKRAKPERPKI